MRKWLFMMMVAALVREEDLLGEGVLELMVILVDLLWGGQQVLCLSEVGPNNNFIKKLKLK